MPTTAINTAAIEIRGLTRDFGDIQALRGLDLTVPSGSIFGFLGPNGAGKTTTLSILAGLTRPAAGEAWICGLDAVADSLEVRRRLGFLRQNPRFYGWMTGRETLQFTGRFFDLTVMAIDRRADELLDLVDLTGAARRKVEGYSGGMRQRLGIAQALMGRPEVLLLDEPSSALDPAGRFEVIQIMERLRRSTTVFYSTHILQDVERVADHVAIISEGRRVLQAPMRELLAGSRNSLVVEVEGNAAPLISDLRGQPYVSAVESTADAISRLTRIRLEVDDLAVARREVPTLVLAHDMSLIALRAEQPTLEETFLALTADAPAGAGS